jgi:hypothetical protein
MKQFFRLPLLAFVAATLALPSCNKASDPNPTSQLNAQKRSADGTLLLLRGTTYNFPGLGATQNGQSIDLTGIVSSDGPNHDGYIPMTRKNYLEQANGTRFTSTWTGALTLNQADFPNTPFPYQHTGTFQDQDAFNNAVVFNVSFNIDSQGNASATLKSAN